MDSVVSHFPLGLDKSIVELADGSLALHLRRIRLIRVAILYSVNFLPAGIARYSDAFIKLLLLLFQLVSVFI